MPYYMIQVAYTAEALARLVKDPEDRTKAIRPSIERLGGKMEGAWFSFGEYDAVVILQAPDNAAAMSMAMAFGGGGAVKSIKTTPLFTGAEGVRAMKKAAGAGYRPPGR